MMSFWSFGWSQAEDKAEPSESENVPTLDISWEKPNGWASVLEGFRDRSRDGRTTADLSPPHAALRAFTRRAHQLLAKQHQRSCQSRRAVAQDHNYATERLSLALAEAEELDDFLRQMKGSEPPSSSREDTDDHVERLSGWSTAASSGGSKASDHLLSRWECEDAELRQELHGLQGSMASAAAELRSGLWRLKSDCQGTEMTTLSGALATALPQLAQSCADAMHGGEDDWATAEAQLYEALATFCRVETADPDFARIPDLETEMLFAEMPGHSRSAEEQRDQRALQSVLQRIETVSQRMEQEASGAADGDFAKRAAEVRAKWAADQQRKLFLQARQQLEAQVERLMQENQALEAKFEVERARLAEERDAGPKRQREKLSPAERLALSNRLLQAKSRDAGELAAVNEQPKGLPAERNSIHIFGSQRRVLFELRKELAETYEVLALKSLPQSDRQLVLARRALELKSASRSQRKGKTTLQKSLPHDSA